MERRLLQKKFKVMKNLIILFDKYNFTLTYTVSRRQEKIKQNVTF